MWIAGGVGIAIVAIATMFVAFTILAPSVPDRPRDKQRSSLARALEDEPVARAVEVDPDAPTFGETQAIDECDAARLGSIVEAYNHDRKFAASVRAATQFAAKCKRGADVDYAVLYALEHLERWKEAEALADKLLRAEPGDADYWWWRGSDRDHLGQHARAVVDIRQSLADADARSNGVQIDPLGRAGRSAGQPCEAAFGLRWLAGAGVDLADSAKREMVEQLLANDCNKLDGKGQLAWTAGTRRTKLAGTVAGKRVTVLIDVGLGTTLVRGESTDGERVDVRTPTGLGTGVASTMDVSVGGARAPAVPVVIVDSLPDGIDAVVGLSFLWRFDVKRDGDGFRATTPKAVVE
jgi:hypothetical protein